MFLRSTIRQKDGKHPRYWSVVESCRVGGGRVAKRPLLYLGEINDSQAAAWRKTIEVLEDGSPQPRKLSLFPEDRTEGLAPDDTIVRLRLLALQLRRPRQWGWLLAGPASVGRAASGPILVGPSDAKPYGRTVGPDPVRADRIPADRPRQRMETASPVVRPLPDVLGTGADLAEVHKLYACHDRLLAHKDALFRHLRQPRRICSTPTSTCCSMI
ncbi:hypothetical protein [Rhodopila sp.]|uniref:hypothetical protein n=1 Tax=Rhodopila sp. TaxID=2480087 RepID=UPI003D106E9A